MKLKLTLDRYEGDLGVCFDGDDRQYEIPKGVLGSLEEGDIFMISHSDGVFSDPEFLKQETEEKREKLRLRLNRIFARSKKEDNN